MSLRIAVLDRRIVLFLIVAFSCHFACDLFDRGEGEDRSSESVSYTDVDRSWAELAEIELPCGGGEPSTSRLRENSRRAWRTSIDDGGVGAPPR